MIFTETKIPGVFVLHRARAAERRSGIVRKTVVRDWARRPYVAGVIDLLSRPVVDRLMGAGMSAQLVTDALVMIIWRWVNLRRCCITPIAAGRANSNDRRGSFSD